MRKFEPKSQIDGVLRIIYEIFFVTSFYCDTNITLKVSYNL